MTIRVVLKHVVEVRSVSDRYCTKGIEARIASLAACGPTDHTSQESLKPEFLNPQALKAEYKEFNKWNNDFRNLQNVKPKNALEETK